MNITQKFNLFITKGVEGDQFRRKVAAVAIAIPIIVLIALGIYVAVAANAPEAAIVPQPASLSASPELMLAQRSAATIVQSANPELIVAQRFANSSSKVAFPRTAAELSLASNYGAGEVMLARRYAAEKGKIAAVSELSANPELIIVRRSTSPAVASPYARTTAELEFAQRYLSKSQENIVFERTPAELEFAQRYHSKGQFNTAFERTPAELEFAQHYVSAGQKSTSLVRTLSELNFAAQYGATKDLLIERYSGE